MSVSRATGTACRNPNGHSRII